MKKTTLIITLLVVAINGYGQSKPKKKVEKPKSDTISSMFGLSGISGIALTLSNYQPQPDTVQSYFKEITGVKDGELITRWVKGFKVVKQSGYGYTYINPGTDFLYPDKTKVINTIIQSY